jgi:hypothetical protein
MALKLLIAGCSSDERDSVASIAKSVLGNRPKEEPWNVSMVKVANQWSVTIDGPEPRYKGLNFVAPSEKLAGELRNEISRAGTTRAAIAGSKPTAGAAERIDRHDCQECASAFEVIYQASAEEPQELAPVACPHCWHVNHVPIAAGAGITGDYRAQAAS